MSPSDLEEMLLENPDKAHRLTLASGDEVIVPNARSAAIEGISLRILGYVAADRLLARKSRLVSIPNIVMAQVVDDRPPRRRRK